MSNVFAISVKCALFLSGLNKLPYHVLTESLLYILKNIDIQEEGNYRKHFSSHFGLRLLETVSIGLSSPKLEIRIK